MNEKKIRLRKQRIRKTRKKKEGKNERKLGGEDEKEK